jgi:hypothetical protein
MTSQPIWTERVGHDLVPAGEHVFFRGPAANAFVTPAG